MKYKLKTKIGTPVIKIEINIRSELDKFNRTTLNKEGIFIENHKIIYQTSKKIALNDLWITNFNRQKIDEKKDSYKNFIDECCVSIKTNENYFCNGIFGTLYTLGDKDSGIKKLTKYMQKEVDKKYGFLSNINISDAVKKLIDEIKDNK